MTHPLTTAPRSSNLAKALSSVDTLPQDKSLFSVMARLYLSGAEITTDDIRGQPTLISHHADAEQLHSEAQWFRDQHVYDHYRAFCRSVGCDAHPIEQWDAERDLQVATAPNVERTRRKRDVFIQRRDDGNPIPEAIRSLTPACLQRGIETPITFDTHVARDKYDARRTGLPFIRQQIVPATYKGPGSWFIARQALQVRPSSNYCPLCVERVSFETHECVRTVREPLTFETNVKIGNECFPAFVTLHKISKVKGEYVRVPLTINGLQVTFDRKQTVFVGQQKTEKKGKYVPDNHVCPALIGSVEDQHNTIDQQHLLELLHNENAIALQTAHQQQAEYLHKMFAIPADAHDRLTVPDAVVDAREKRNNRHVSPIADVLVVTRRINAWISNNGRSSWLLENSNVPQTPAQHGYVTRFAPYKGCQHAGYEIEFCDECYEAYTQDPTAGARLLPDLVRDHEWDERQSTEHSRKVRKSKGLNYTLGVSPQHYAICPQTLPGRCKHELSKERCSICNPIKVVVPSKPRCNHVNSRSHTFTTGETIQFCPDCAYKTIERRTIFRTSPVESAIEIVRKEEQLRREWDARLATEDLPTEATLMGEEERLKHKASPHLVIERQAAGQDGRVCQVNTSSIGLDSLGFGVTKDRCRRDYRADERWEKETHVLPTPGWCVLCGDEFYDRAGTLHCSDNHRKRYSELRAEFVRRNTLDIPQPSQWSFLNSIPIEPLPQWGVLNYVTTINTWFKQLWVNKIAVWL